MSSLAEELEREAAAFSGRVGFSVSDLSTGESIHRLENETFPTASTIKLPILTAFQSFVAEGRASWDDVVHIDASDVAPGSGILQHLDLPRELSLRDAAWLMICLSDNTATNILLRALTLDTANRLIENLIGEDIHIDKFAGYELGAPVRSMGRATPLALGNYLNDLARGDLPGSQETLAIAAEQVYRSTIPRYLPDDSFDPGGLTIANKTGALPGIRADIAVLTTRDRTVTMAFMTADADDLGDSFANEGQECIGRMARLVYDSWSGVTA
jgi:beta-lactamase class A